MSLYITPYRYGLLEDIAAGHVVENGLTEVIELRLPDRKPRRVDAEVRLLRDNGYCHRDNGQTYELTDVARAYLGEQS